MDSRALLEKWVELAERTLEDHFLRLDANRTADFAQGIRETRAVLDQTTHKPSPNTEHG